MRWQEAPVRARALITRVAAYGDRALREPGPERAELVLGAKSVTAAVVAWVLARHLLPVAVATFAPFTALIALRRTVYRSVRDCVQYVAAMGAGASLAAALAAWAGIHAWSFAVLVLLALTVGRLHRLGAQGVQVAVVAFFAFSSGGGRIDYIGHLAASVAIGAACGLAIHILLAPAGHLFRHQRTVASICSEIASETRALAEVFDHADTDPHKVRRMRSDWRRLASDCDRLHGSLDEEADNARLNPRTAPSTVPSALARTRETLTVAQRCLDHLRSITRTVEYLLTDSHHQALQPAFRSGYRDVLDAAAAVVEEIGQAAPTDPARLRDLLERTADRVTDLEALMRPEAAPAAPTLQGTLLTDASRLLTDIRGNLHVLAPDPTT